MLPLSWLVAELWKARKNTVKPNTGRVPYKVVITGGSRGLGCALAHEFLSMGDEVVIASRNASACETAAAKLQQQHPQGTVLQHSCDVSQPEDVQQLAAFARQQLGQIDIWVNNAGVSQLPKAPLADTSVEEIQQVISTNMLGALLGSKAAMQTMNAQPSGGRIFLIDGAGSRGTATANSATYGSTKAAMPQLLRSLAAEVKQSKVSVHLASPGMVATDLLLKGVSNPRAAKIVNILAEDPKVVAAWLAPRMRGVAGNGTYFKYLTPLGVLMRFLTARRRRNRFLSWQEAAKSA